MRRIERVVAERWVAADTAGRSALPHEFLYQILLSGSAQAVLPDRPEGQLDGGGRREEPADLRARLGRFDARQHVFAAWCIGGKVTKSDHDARRHRIHDRTDEVVRERLRRASSIGFFQIGGGIAGDFPICVVPMMHQDLRMPDVRLWGYFCQISDSTTSYGSYSGAVPNEKITWGKLGPDTPSFIIESDATIVAPLVFAKVLGW